MAAMTHPFLTIGHSTHTVDEFAAMLRGADVELLVDIRSTPYSRHCPQFNREALGPVLAPYGIDYAHMPALGGHRRAQGIPAEVNALWAHRSFHNYADYTLTDEFRAGLEDLIARGRQQRLAYMCAEAEWWRCHRRIVTDCLLAAGETVLHIMGAGRISPASLTGGATCEHGRLSYTAPASKVAAS